MRNIPQQEIIIGKQKVRHLSEMFKKHLTSNKQKINALIARSNILAMLRKGNVLTQITTLVSNALLKLKEFLKCVLIPYNFWRKKNELKERF